MSLLEGATAATYHSFQARTVAGSSKTVGITEGWAAPIAVFEAPNGFGEEAWVSALPITTLATRLRGAAVTWRGGKLAGRTSHAGSSALQPKGSVNHSLAAGSIRFSQIYFEDGLLDVSGSPFAWSEAVAQKRMELAGVAFTATNTVIAELAQDWSSPNGAELIRLLFTDVLPEVHSVNQGQAAAA